MLLQVGQQECDAFMMMQGVHDEAGSGRACPLWKNDSVLGSRIY